MNKHQILMIDDDAEDQWIIREAMEILDNSEIAYFASNGEQAIQLLDTAFIDGVPPSLIVLDLNMPKMNGTATLGKLKADQRFNNIPVIIYSTSVNPFEKAKCMDLGAHSYITKPISVQESVSTAETFLSFCH